MLLLLLMTFGSLSASGEGRYAANEITEWQMQWGSGAGDTGLEAPHSGQGHWFSSGRTKPAGDLPEGISSAWTKIQLPVFNYVSPAVYIEKLYGLHIRVFVEDRLVLEGDRSYIKDNYSLLVPLSSEDNGKTLYIWASTLQDRIGVKDAIQVGEHSELIRHFVKNGLIDVILGGAFIFVALVLFMCGFFLDREHFSIAVSLSIVIAATGILAVTYSPFIYTFYSSYGALSVIFLDLGLLSLLPALTFLFERIFGSGRFSIIRRFRIFQTAYSLFCMVFLIVNTLADNRFVEGYYFVSTTVIGFIMIAQFILLIACVILFSLKKNKDAITFAIGFGTAALTGVSELVWYYIKNGDYDLFYWKWALVVFILSLIVILGRRLALNHRQVVQYSQELELFNNELQRSEKMEIISELAASVAHEVRNPLQVTRGFLQLLSEKASGSEAQYLSMALSELDRAANIITDFLTFAKPEFEQISILNVREEFKHIESIMLPLCHLNGGKMIMEAGEGLWVKGNSSKFKQAFINIIKNSIESLGDEGTIHMIAYGVGPYVYIHIQDDGEGMDQEVLNRLGEPYFSNKTKGTGLGLMVTFRIIEAMAGEVRFESKKGAGTETVTTLPLAEAPGGSDSL